MLGFDLFVTKLMKFVRRDDLSGQIMAISNGEKIDVQPKSKSRSSNKLLSSVNNDALALLRLDQVSAAEKGEISFRLAGKEGRTLEDCTLTHHWPDWWPKVATEE